MGFRFQGKNGHTADITAMTDLAPISDVDPFEYMTLGQLGGKRRVARSVPTMVFPAKPLSSTALL
jgi:hypothetical protein